MRLRIARPNVQIDWEGWWFIRYWHDELLPSNVVKTARRVQRLGPRQGSGALTRAEAEARRDEFVAQLKALPVRTEPLMFPQDRASVGEILFGHLAETWEWDFVERLVGGKHLIAATTQDKYRRHLHNHIMPRWAEVPIGDFRARAVLDWLLEVSGSWHMMLDLRNIMSGIFTKAQEWEILPDTMANPIARVRMPKKWQVHETRILTEEETVRVLERLADPYRLVCEICVTTGARISEVLGLQIRHVLLDRACIRIEQRVWRGDVDSPKTERSKRTLTVGSLVGRLEKWIEGLPSSSPHAWVFPQRDPRKVLWDTAVRERLKRAAQQENCDFPGFGPHSFRRANITWRQEVGGSSIEASRIAGHASTKMTEQYTVVQLARQEELTRRIQAKLAAAAGLKTIETEEMTTQQKALAFVPTQSHECDPERSHTMAKKQSGKNKKAIELRAGSKKAKVIQMLQRPDGATLEGLMKATGWQAHSVRGFLSAAVSKKMGLQVNSTKRDDGQRVYRIA